MTALQETLSKQSWDTVLVEHDVDKAYEKFLQIFKAAYCMTYNVQSNHIQLKQKRIKAFG